MALFSIYLYIYVYIYTFYGVLPELSSVLMAAYMGSQLRPSSRAGSAAEQRDGKGDVHGAGRAQSP